MSNTILCPRCNAEMQDRVAWSEEYRKVRMRVLVRDNFRCQEPQCNCNRLEHLTIHHLRARAAGGLDKPANLITLCRFHHWLRHDAGTMKAAFVVAKAVFQDAFEGGGL